MSGPRRFSTFLDVVSVGLLAVAVWLFWQARRPAAPQGLSTSLSAVASASRIGVGSRIPAFTVADSAGATQAGIAADGRAHLVFVFRSDCPACALQKPEWEALAGQARERGIQTAAYTPETLTPGVARYFGQAPVTVARFADAASAGNALDLRLVPTTFLLDAEGHVLFHHQGVMPAAVADSVRGLVADLATVH